MAPKTSLPTDTALPGIPAAVAGEIAAALRAVADPARAAPMAAYMRSRFVFLGVATPLRRAATRTPIAAARATRDGDLALAVAAALWQEPWRECHYAGVDLLAACAEALGPAALPVLETLIVSHSWWDTIDGLAKHVVGAIVLRHRGAAATMDRWAVAPNPWLRRTAILHQLGYKEATDGDRLFRHCLANAGDPDFFLRKGIGWALRQYAYVEPGRVAGFLDAHADLLSPLSRREAAKHLSAPPRDRTAPPGRGAPGAPARR
jgi:3-methyladenine DNA glycosylase AlkD